MQRYRFLVGMRSGVFPRNPPSGLLIPVEFRHEVNELHSGFYILSPQTDYENEVDFFEAALGPDGTDSIALMPYLTERGNKEEWSCFISSARELVDSRLASQMTPEMESTSTPRYHWMSVAEMSRGHDRLPEFFQSNIDPRWQALTSHSIEPRLEVIVNRIINDRQEVDVPSTPSKDEPYLDTLCSSITNDPVPIFEIDLIEDCPLVYYFYRFLYSFEDFINKGIEERRYVPEWKNDFRRGPVPPALRRKHFSTDMRRILTNVVTTYQSSQRLKVNRGKVTTMISKGKLEYYGKAMIGKAVDFLIAKNLERISIKGARESSSIHGSWIPDEVKYRQESNYHLVHFARATPRVRGFRQEQHSLQRQPPYLRNVRRRVELLAGTRGYNNMDPTEVESHIQSIKSFQYRASGYLDRCEDCVYSTLCGYWGF
jgi:hypothetical protein